MAGQTIFAGNSVLVSAPSVTVPVGVHPFGPVTLPSALGQVVVAFDITSHGDGSAASVAVAVELSLDGGATWQPFFSFERDKGYAPIAEPGIPTGWAYMRVPKLPQPGNPNRQVRGTLTISNAPLTTAVQVEGQ